MAYAVCSCGGKGFQKTSHISSTAHAYTKPTAPGNEEYNLRYHWEKVGFSHPRYEPEPSYHLDQDMVREMDKFENIVPFPRRFARKSTRVFRAEPSPFTGVRRDKPSPLVLPLSNGWTDVPAISFHGRDVSLPLRGYQPTLLPTTTPRSSIQPAVSVLSATATTTTSVTDASSSSSVSSPFPPTTTSTTTTIQTPTAQDPVFTYTDTEEASLRARLAELLQFVSSQSRTLAQLLQTVAAARKELKGLDSFVQYVAGEILELKGELKEMRDDAGVLAMAAAGYREEMMGGRVGSGSGNGKWGGREVVECKVRYGHGVAVWRVLL